MSTAAAPKERPIPFAAHEVQATLDGRKSQFRRVVKPKDAWYRRGDGEPDWVPSILETGEWGWIADGCTVGIIGRCPYGVPGDRLSLQDENGNEFAKGEITEVRVERVSWISEADAIAEGIEVEYVWGVGTAAYAPDGTRTHPEDAFRQLWDSIYAKRGFGWDVNPWVWAVGFKVIEPAREREE